MKARSKLGSSSGKASAVWQEVWGIIFIFLGAFVLLALLSYNHSDPSVFSHTNRLPMNYTGRIGANISEGLIQFAGLAAFIFCATFFSCAGNFFRNSEKGQHLLNVLLQVVAIITCATFLGLVIGPIPFGGTRIASGGLLGAWLSGILLHYLNLWGATLFTLCILLIAMVFATPISAAKLFSSGSKLSAATGVATWAWLTNAAQLIRQTIQKRRTEKLLAQKVAQGALKTEAKPAEVKHQPLIIEGDDLQDEEEDEVDLSKLKQKASAKSKEDEDAQDTFEVVTAAVLPKKPLKKFARATPSVRGNFTLPPLEFLNEAPVPISSELDRSKLRDNSRILETKLLDFGIEGQVVAVKPGPVITMYEFKPGSGVKISKIANLADDLSLALSAKSVRIIAPIPGKNVVGIEIPNDVREKVVLREILATDEFQGSMQGIPLAVGKDIAGVPLVTDLAKMPHLLIAGAPGAGKSVFINSLICSLLYKFTPNDMRLIMVDPKQLELNLYENIPHLLLPVVDDPKKASTALKWAVNEMERRYKIMAKSGIRNLAGFNEKFEKEGEDKMRQLLCPEDSEGMPSPNSLAHLFDFDEKGKPRIERMPAILVIIDEFADLMMAAPKDIETSVARLAQKARAAGLHLVIATQRPSVDVITGLIKGNLPSRISFQVPTKIDSRTILDGMGAEKLLGQGDMLFMELGKLSRIHGAYVGEEEIGKICDHWRKQGSPVYKEEILLEPEDMEDVDNGDTDELYSEALLIVRQIGQASASMLQRRLKVGYNRAARMVETMERQGIVGPADGAKPREVLMF